MSEHPDLWRNATDYRDHLRAELARVEDFIATADRLSEADPAVGADAPLPGGEIVPFEMH